VRPLTKLLVATNNPGKVREYEQLLNDLPVEITFPAGEGLSLEVDESGETFEENARIKAVAYARASGLLTLADDSGLEVDVLGGGPGVRCRMSRPDSARPDFAASWLWLNPAARSIRPMAGVRARSVSSPTASTGSATIRSLSSKAMAGELWLSCRPI
jgi:hypothetical protein